MIKQEKILQFVKNKDKQKLFTRKEHLRGMFILKYANKVFYNNLWCDELQNMRGTVVDKDYKVLQRPFTKIFNYGENNTRIDRDEPVKAVEKINGFMVAASWVDGHGLLVSTTGSLTSDFVDLGRRWIEKYPLLLEQIEKNSRLTYLFECVDESDPHIIDEEVGLYLIGTRFKAWNVPNHHHTEEQLDELAMIVGVKRPKHYTYNRFSDLIQDLKTVKHEGFVVWGLETGKELKLKSPFYLATKFIGRLNDSRLLRLLEHPDEIKKIIDEEFYGIIDHVQHNLDSFMVLTKQERIEYVRNYFNGITGN